MVPLTTNQNASSLPFTYILKPTPSNNLRTTSIALVSQVGALDKRKILNPIGHVDGKDMGEINSMLKELLRL